MKELSLKEPRPADSAIKLSTWIQKMKRETDILYDEYYPIIIGAYCKAMKKASERKGTAGSTFRNGNLTASAMIKLSPEDAPILKEDIEKSASELGYTIVWIPALSRHPGYPR